MIGLRINFDLGRYHATPWGSHVNDGQIEWPPSPWRLLRGLYAVARTNTPLNSRQGSLDRALATLAAAGPPVFELPPAHPAHTRHYMPVPAGKAEKSSKVLDGFLAVDPNASLVAWWDAKLDRDGHEALKAVARALGYLGRSESVCSADLDTRSGPDKPNAMPLDAFTGSDNELDTIDLLCVDSADPVSALSIGVTEVRRRKLSLPPGSKRVTYGIARAQVEPVRVRHSDSEPPCIALFRLRGSSRLAMTEAVAAGQALRSALQSQFGDVNKGASSPTFSGRSGDGRRRDQHRHAHYLALPDGHGRLVDRLLVWAPEGFGPDEVTALARLRKVWSGAGGVPGLESLPVGLAALGSVDELHIPSVLGPSPEWKSLTPFGLVRYPKERKGGVVDSPEDQVMTELKHRGFPTPRSVEVATGAQWHRFRSSKIGTSRQRRAPLVEVTVRFEESVPGPLVIGALSHYGLGLMQPTSSA